MALADPMRRHAVLFDLDGTLVDTVADIQATLNGLLGEQGCGGFSLPEVTGMIGGGVAKLIDRAVDAVGAAVEPGDRARWVARFLELYAAEPARFSQPYPGARAVLGLLQQAGYRLAVCTNKPEDIATVILERFDLLRFFEAVLGEDGIRPRKPDPTILREAMARLGTEAAATVMVGDSTADLGAGRNAGTAVVLVRYGYGVVSGLAPDLMIDALDALPPALERLRASGKPHASGDDL